MVWWGTFGSYYNEMTSPLPTISWGSPPRCRSLLALLAVVLAAEVVARPQRTLGLEILPRAEDQPAQAQPPQDSAASADVLFPLRVAWSADLGEPVVAPPGVDASRAYVPLESGALAAVSLADGAVVWKTPHPTTSAPASNGELVFAAGHGRIEALAATTGVTRWHTPLDDEIAAPLVERAGWLIVPLASGEVLALRSSNGELVWRRAFGAVAAGQPAIDGDRLYLPLDDSRVIAAHIFSGDVLWTRKLDGPASGVLVYGGEIYVSSTDNFFYHLDDREGTVNWRWRTGADLVGRADAREARVVFVSLDTVLRAHDWLHGAQRWRTPLPWRPRSGPQIVGETVVMSGLVPEVRGYALDTGKEIGHLTFASSDVEQLQGPVIAVQPTRPGGTRLVAVSAEGKVYGLAPEKPDAAK